jgi:hypothetical protein
VLRTKREAASKRHLIPNRVVAKGVQLRLLRQRVVMAAQNTQADVLLHRLYYALPGWDAAAERRRGGEARRRQGRNLAAASMPSAALRRLCARPCCVYTFAKLRTASFVVKPTNGMPK